MMFGEMKSFVPFAKFAQIVAQIGFVATTFFCFILVFLTMFGVKRNFGSYKYLLVMFPAVGISFATLELILYPNVHSHNAGFIFYSTSRPFNMGTEAVTWLLSFYTGVYASTISMLSVQFVYRYWAIFDETKLRFFKGWKFCICIAYSTYFGIHWGLGVHYLLKMDKYSKTYIKEVMLQKYNTDISEIAGLASIAYDANGNLRWLNVLGSMNMTSIMLIQYTIIIYCAVCMYRGMEEKLQMLSLSLRNLHKQFFKTLILQIILPTITLFSPVILIIYLPLLDLEVDIPTGVFLCAFTLYPAMDAFIAMYVVKDYGKAARNMLKTYVGKLYVWLSRSENDQTTTSSKLAATNKT